MRRKFLRVLKPSMSFVMAIDFILEDPKKARFGEGTVRRSDRAHRNSLPLSAEIRLRRRPLDRKRLVPVPRGKLHFSQ
jgi:hypothetical protein